MAALLVAFLLSGRPLGLCLVGWNCTGPLLMHHLQILPLGISVSLPSPELQVISVGVSTREAGSQEGFLHSLKFVFSHLQASPPHPTKGSDISFEL